MVIEKRVCAKADPPAIKTKAINLDFTTCPSRPKVMQEVCQITTLTVPVICLLLRFGVAVHHHQVGCFRPEHFLICRASRPPTAKFPREPAHGFRWRQRDNSAGYRNRG